MRLNIPEIIAELVHLNTRKEMHGDESILACDLKFKVVLPAEDLLSQVFIGDPAPFYNAFWTDTGQQREPTLSKISMSHVLNDHILRISVGISDWITCDDVTLKKLNWTAENGRTVNLTFTAQMNPDEEEVAHFAAGLGTHVQIAIDPPRQMDIGDATGDDKDEEDEAAA